MIEADSAIYNAEDDYVGDVIGKLANVNFKAYSKAKKYMGELYALGETPKATANVSYLMAEEYMRWIDFYHKGDGDYADFLTLEGIN